LKRVGNFVKDFIQGNVDAQPVIERLESLGYQVEPASKQEDMKEGIDFYIVKDDFYTSIQLKCCRRVSDTNNVYLQTSKVMPTPDKNKTVNATHWLYYDTVGKILYNFRTSELVNKWSEIKESGRLHNMFQVGGNSTEGYIVSLSKLKELGINFKEVKL
jgi:hypothetical protein